MQKYINYVHLYVVNDYVVPPNILHINRFVLNHDLQVQRLPVLPMAAVHPNILIQISLSHQVR